ncbi:MAG: choice-of-anchor R domain-containing protein [Mycobacteriales bacterium]
MKRRFASVVFVCVFAGLWPGVSAAGTLDQSQTSYPNNAVIGDGSPPAVAQTFTAGVTGALDEVDMPLSNADSGSDITVTIQTAEDGLPGPTILATATVPAAGLPSFGAPSFVSVPLASPASVEAGTQYAIVVSASSGVYGVGVTLTDAYPGGSEACFCGGGWVSEAPSDLAFKTYVAPTPPDTTILSHPANRATRTSATFTFEATEEATFECSLDGGGWIACESPAIYTGLSKQSHTFRVRATNGADNTDPTPATFNWTNVKKLAIKLTQKPPSKSTSSTATFAYTISDPGAFLKCTLDGAPVSCDTPETFTSLANGRHTFTITAVDAAKRHATLSYGWNIKNQTR